jgi:hypothetical protein
MLKAVIYLGPSLDLTTAQSLFKATYLPPIKRGDLGKLGADVQSVGIIDGEFFQSPSVSTMEILALLDRGVKVYGASSIGALRAVETELFGMIGVGEIFEWFRDGIVDADDEVALSYDPFTYQPLSEPLINIRFALRGAVAERYTNNSKAIQVIQEIRKVYFPFRSLNLVYQLCPEVKAFICKHQPNRKRDDALLLLRALAEQ